MVRAQKQTIEKGHGNIDKPYYKPYYKAYHVTSQYFDQRWDACLFTTLSQVEWQPTILKTNQQSEETVLFLSHAPIRQAQELFQAVRQYWSVETSNYFFIRKPYFIIFLSFTFKNPFVTYLAFRKKVIQSIVQRMVSVIPCNIPVLQNPAGIIAKHGPVTFRLSYAWMIAEVVTTVHIEMVILMIDPQRRVYTIRVTYREFCLSVRTVCAPFLSLILSTPPVP